MSLAEAVRTRSDLAIPWQERFGFIHHAAFRRLVPDYGFLLQHATGRLVCFVEVLSGEESPTRMGDRLRRYADWALLPDTEDFLADLYRRHGAVDPRPQFRLLCVVQDRRTGYDDTRLVQLLMGGRTLPRPMRDRLWAATVASLRTAASVDDPLWVRLKDLPADSPPRNRRMTPRTFVSQLPRHRMFPSREEVPDAAPCPDHTHRVDDPRECHDGRHHPVCDSP